MVSPEPRPSAVGDSVESWLPVSLSGMTGVVVSVSGVVVAGCRNPLNGVCVRVSSAWASRVALPLELGELVVSFVLGVAHPLKEESLRATKNG